MIQFKGITEKCGSTAYGQYFSMFDNDHVLYHYIVDGETLSVETNADEVLPDTLMYSIDGITWVKINLTKEVTTTEHGGDL